MSEKFTWHFPEDVVFDPAPPAVRRKASKGREMRVLADDELKRFLKVAERSGPRDDALFHLMFYYALRVGEVVALSMIDINAQARPERQVTIRALKGGLTKTYDIPSWLWRKIARWMRHRLPADSPYLFPHRDRDDTPASREGVQCSFKALAKRVGITRMVSVHDLRHTAATKLAMNGDSLVDVAGWLRHRSLTSSQRYIDHRNNKEHERRVKQRFAKGIV
ncbi:MAG: site-specific integrase [Methanosarcinaceae archaeon]|nr:site-specific integrase [Methanosarcinaceae archaeon]